MWIFVNCGKIYSLSLAACLPIPHWSSPFSSPHWMNGSVVTWLSELESCSPTPGHTYLSLCLCVFVPLSNTVSLTDEVTAEITAQPSALTFVCGDFVRQLCSYKILECSLLITTDKNCICDTFKKKKERRRSNSKSQFLHSLINQGLFCFCYMCLVFMEDWKKHYPKVQQQWY